MQRCYAGWMVWGERRSRRWMGQRPGLHGWFAREIRCLGSGGFDLHNLLCNYCIINTCKDSVFCLTCQLSYAYPCQNTTEAIYRKWKASDPALLQDKHLGQEHQHWLPCRMQCALSSFVFTAYIKCRSSTWLTCSPAHCFVQSIPLAVKVTQAERGKRCCNADTTIPRSILNYAYGTVLPGSIQARDQHHSHSQSPVPRIRL